MLSQSACLSLAYASLFEASHDPGALMGRAPLLVSGDPFFTVSYDLGFTTCYDIGEYQTLTRSANDHGAAGLFAAWGDNRNSWIGPVGSAEPVERATPAPNASAERSSVPTFPGSATRQSASVTGRVPRGRSSRR